MAKTLYTFYWDTKLSGERQAHIKAWLDSLTEEDGKMLSDILDDHYKSVEHDCTCEC